MARARPGRAAPWMAALSLIASVVGGAGCGSGRSVHTEEIPRPIYVGYDCLAVRLRPGERPYVKTIPKSTERCRKQFDARRLLGLSVKSARARAGEHGLVIREVVIDGKDAMITLDRRSDRIDVTVADDRVVGIRGVG